MKIFDEVVLNIQRYDDRDKIVSILARAGYKVWQTEQGETWEKQYFVHIENPEIKQK